MDSRIFSLFECAVCEIELKLTVLKSAQAVILAKLFFKFSFPCIIFLFKSVSLNCNIVENPVITFKYFLLFIQMENNQLYADEADPKPTSWISSTANGKTHQPTSSTNKVQSRKRQRKTSEKTAKCNVQKIIDATPQPDYRPSLGPGYAPSQMSPYWNIGQLQYHQFAQRTPIPFAYPFNPYNQWLPPLTLPHTATSQSYNQFNQQPETAQSIPPVKNMMSTSFYPYNPPTAMSHLHSQSQFGAAESKPQSPRYDLNYSPMYSSAMTDLEALMSCQYEGGRPSAFQMYKRSPNDDTTDVKTEQSHNQSNLNFEQTSPTLNLNCPYSTLTANGDNDTNEVIGINGQIDDKKVFYPAGVLDEKYDFSCVICQETKKDTVLMPCRHLCVCEKCCKDIVLCPLCRQPFEKSMTVFT